MSDVFAEFNTVYKGRSINISHHFDYDHGSPWAWDAGGMHGPVSEWRDIKSKRPGEIVLCRDKESARFYDFEEATKIAKRDGWGVHPDKAIGLTKKQIARLAVIDDFERLKGWCDDRWHYMGIMVEDEETHVSDSSWGIESDCEDYIQEITNELMEEIYLPSIQALIREAI